MKFFLTGKFSLLDSLRSEFHVKRIAAQIVEIWLCGTAASQLEHFVPAGTLALKGAWTYAARWFIVWADLKFGSTGTGGTGTPT